MAFKAIFMVAGTFTIPASVGVSTHATPIVPRGTGLNPAPGEKIQRSMRDVPIIEPRARTAITFPGASNEYYDRIERQRKIARVVRLEE